MCKTGGKSAFGKLEEKNTRWLERTAAEKARDVAEVLRGWGEMDDASLRWRLERKQSRIEQLPGGEQPVSINRTESLV